MSNSRQDDQYLVPQHVAFILDGNRRWAEKNGLPKLEGHRRGAEVLKSISEKAFDRGVKYFSAFVFSTENWKRTKEEVGYLMDLMLQLFKRDIKDIHKKGIKVVWLGMEAQLSKRHLKAISDAVELTKNNTKGTLALCFNYGGKQEIIDTAKKLIRMNVDADDVDEVLFQDSMYVPALPPIDLVVRTSGEHRLSNFMLWQAAYAELSFIDTYWPDFNEMELDKVLSDYASRHRRFGV